MKCRLDVNVVAGEEEGGGVAVSFVEITTSLVALQSWLCLLHPRPFLNVVVQCLVHIWEGLYDVLLCLLFSRNFQTCGWRRKGHDDDLRERPNGPVKFEFALCHRGLLIIIHCGLNE